MTATIELVAAAKLEPSRPGPVAEPATKEPPWILQICQRLATGTQICRDVPHEGGGVAALGNGRRDVEEHGQAVLSANCVAVVVLLDARLGKS